MSTDNAGCIVAALLQQHSERLLVLEPHNWPLPSPADALGKTAEKYWRPGRC